jgi:hypothetical protein
MNVRLITGAIFVLIILSGLGLFFMNSQNTKYLTERISPTAEPTSMAVTPSAILSDALTAASQGQRVTFRYPRSWNLRETTVQGGRGTFGIILQSWILQSFLTREAGQDGIPDNTAKIDIEIETAGGDLPLERLVDCGMKTTCEKVGIDNEQFIMSEGTLNSGMKSLSVATFFDNKILRMHALIAPGVEQAKLTEIVNAIFQSIKFSEPPQS